MQACRCLRYTLDAAEKVYQTNDRMCMLYDVGKRTNIILDMELVDEAAHVLGTEQTTATVHAALRDVVMRARRARLAGRDFEDLTDESLDEMRRASARMA